MRSIVNFQELTSGLLEFGKSATGQTLIIAGVLLYLSWQMLSPLHFLITDTALRFTQVEQIVAHDWQTLAIDYPQRLFDPELEHLVFTGAAGMVDGQLYLMITPYLPIMAAFFYSILGSGGLGIVPAIGGIFTAVALYKLARFTRLPYPSLILWTTVFATPILIYSVKLWDHTLATALAAWAIYFTVRGLEEERPRSTGFLLAGGACLGLSLGQRPEMYIFVSAVAATFLLLVRPLFRPGLIIAIGGLAGALPIWISQWVWVGHPLGMAFAANILGYGRIASPTTTTDALTTYSQYFLDFVTIIQYFTALPNQKAVAASIYTIIGATIIVLTIRAQPRFLTGLLLLGLAVLSAGYSMWFDFVTREFVAGILPTLPLFVFALVYPGYYGRWVYNQQAYKFVADVALLFLAFTLLFSGSHGGSQWGSRYLLPLYPLLIFMGWFTFASYEKFLGGSNKKAQAAWCFAAISLLLMSIVLQFAGLRTLRLQQQKVGQIQAMVTDLPAEIILTDHYFFPSKMASVKGKLFFYVTTKEDVEKLMLRFAAGGIEQIAIIPVTYFVPEHPPLEIPDRAGGVILREIEPLIYELHWTHKELGRGK
jgi:hypothetical protein